MTNTAQSEQAGDLSADDIEKIENSECPKCGNTLGIEKTKLDAEGAEISDPTYHVYTCSTTCGFVVEQRMTPESYTAGENQ